jgi:hypothetical protein
MIGSLVWQFIKWHKILGDAVATRLFDRKLPPPTQREQELADELRAALSTDSKVASLPTWVKFRDQVRMACENQDPRSFLRWPIVQHAMCLTNSGAVVPEYLALRASGRWDHFEKAVAESAAGNPVRFLYYPSSSGSLLHHCHHVMSFERATGSDLAGADVILEFGGGYGSMCRLLHRLGFSGRYFIYDLPEFVALQRYFLKSLDLPVRDGAPGGSAAGIYHFTNLESLQKALQDIPSEARKAFIATWSLSESQPLLRDHFLPLVERFDSFLIAFQDFFCEVDNVAYFAGFQRSTAFRVEWTRKRLRELPGNNYLFGKSLCANS